MLGPSSSIGALPGGYPPYSRLALAPPSYGRNNNQLRIVYNNDPHEKLHALPQLVDGFRRFSTEGQMAGMDVLRLSGGDHNIGKESNEWALNVRLLDMMGLHGTALGNHELDQGTKSLSAGLEQANFPTFVSNLKLPPQNTLQIEIRNRHVVTTHRIIQAEQGRYGIIGVTTPELSSMLDKDAAIEGLKVETLEATKKLVAQQVKQLEAHGIHRIIVVSHMGYEADKALAKSVPGIDIIVGGHSHHSLPGIIPETPYNTAQHIPGYHPEIPLPNMVASPTGEPVMILQAGKDAKYIGVLDVAFDGFDRVMPLQNMLHRVANTCKADPLAQATLSYFLGPDKPLAHIATPYDNEAIPFKEDAVAEYVADAIRAVTQADIGFVRSAEIRNSIPYGTLTEQQVKVLMPFSDPMVAVELSGDDIFKALSRSAKSVQAGEPHPGMLHPSGMVVKIDQTRGIVTQALVFNRHIQQWEPLNPHKKYKVGLGLFSVKNGKEFPELGHPEAIVGQTSMTLKDVFCWRMAAEGAPYQCIRFNTDGRLVIQ
ncbi:MAG: 5'-nucleotidase C-terminal domain-containing protein [Cyanobacteria bacterium]|nr:5'-nucleotidase C-terminal domain-containing protein [Cyanobacteriota bacterium]